MEQRTPVKDVIDGFLLDCKVTGKSPKTTAFYKEKLSKFTRESADIASGQPTRALSCSLNTHSGGIAR